MRNRYNYYITIILLTGNIESYIYKLTYTTIFKRKGNTKQNNFYLNFNISLIPSIKTFLSAYTTKMIIAKQEKMLDNITISWKSKLQGRVSFLTIEIEYVAILEAA
ncbi:hypothetical protein V8G54_010036 [Vigna mungo]|uniref:Uncharacterized protein n=1 Tax=Vigna mungo TaxID=3915 RepID=A0AAQ3NVX3_VIGMU